MMLGWWAIHHRRNTIEITRNVHTCMINILPIVLTRWINISAACTALGWPHGHRFHLNLLPFQKHSKTMGRTVSVWLCKSLFNTNHQGLQRKQNYKYQCKKLIKDLWQWCLSHMSLRVFFWSVIVWKLFVSWSKGMGGWALTSLLANACTFPRTAPASIHTSRIAKTQHLGKKNTQFQVPLDDTTSQKKKHMFFQET